MSADVGNEHVCVLDTGNSVTCWGSDMDGLGYTVAPKGPFMEVRAGQYHTCGIRPDCTLFRWGAYVR